MTARRRINSTLLAGVIGIAALGGSAPGRASVDDLKTLTSTVLRTADAALAAPGEVQQRAQLQTARELLDLAAMPWPNALTEAVALAKAGTTGQARTLALDVAPTSTAQVHASPAQAAAALATLYGVNADQGQLARLGQIAGPARDALTHLIDAFASMRTAARVAFVSVDAAAEPALAGVFAARNRMLDAVLELRQAMEPGPAATGACSPLEVSTILSIDIAPCDNTYTQDVALLVDAGGDDRYLNNAGGSGVVSEPCSLEGGLGGAGALIDLAGDDEYGDAADPRSCGANGGAYSGAGFLVDAEGSDAYVAGDTGTNGGSYEGSGFLLDVAGSDTYTAGSVGTNGGSCRGDGFLLDVAGDETYGAKNDCTNGGGGFLVDVAGTDTYTAESYATNGGGTSGLHGFLLDAGGNDSYIAGSFGTNGGGAQPGFGGVGTGFLLDAGGNDSYIAGDGATNGGGWQGAGFLLDVEGDDSYVAGHVAPNGAGDSRGGTGAGLLLDGEGADTYLDQDGGTGADCTRAPKGTFGAQVDLPNTSCKGPAE